MLRPSNYFNSVIDSVIMMKVTCGLAIISKESPFKVNVISAMLKESTALVLV